MPRSRALLTAPIVLAIVLIGVFAIRSRGGDDNKLNTTSDKSCSPVARADAVATKPGTPISIDVLANDTDADGDTLVFQILKTTGGESTVDDGGTPTDASDDRVLFTPAEPAPESGRINYQAVDPSGAIGESTVTVSINAEGTLPPGTRSESIASDPTTGECGTGVPRPTTTVGDVTVSSSPPFTGSVTNTTTKTTSGKTSTKKKSGGSSGGSRTNTTIGSPSSPTTKPPTTNTTKPPTTNTTQPPTTNTSGPPPTTPPSCGDFPTNGSDEEQDAWRQCVKDHSRP
jgi:Bacterial Ig domain